MPKSLMELTMASNQVFPYLILKSSFKNYQKRIYPLSIADLKEMPDICFSVERKVFSAKIRVWVPFQVLREVIKKKNSSQSRECS